MDIEHNAKFMDDIERWDLLKVMSVLEEKINAAQIEQSPLQVEVGIYYRDSRGIWYISHAWMTHRKELKRIVFGPTTQVQNCFPSKDVLQKYLTKAGLV